jgi:hypothetical protein
LIPVEDQSTSYFLGPVGISDPSDFTAAESQRIPEGPIRRTIEGGSEWETIKILIEGDGNSNKMNTTSNTRL